MENYYLDPVTTMNKGLAAYDPAADQKLRQSRYLSKMPGVAYPEPRIQSILAAQAAGPLCFESGMPRQPGSCTRPQLDIMPDRMSTEYYPVPATAATAIEPFPRQGTNTRWLAKDACCSYQTRRKDAR
ncbi:MAG: hypothetical protein EOO40_04570 [Deltaproteobacteria bacterium]|nr:MAG: hypothetical protein EOO40_04570 [Deltaproteobacteria bacterium]